MATNIVFNKEVNQFEFSSMSWEDLYNIMISVITTKKILEKRLKEHPEIPSTHQQINKFKKIINTISSQYPEWAKEAISLLETSISNTLYEHDILNNEDSIR